jgi:hypothetical protein
MAYPPYDYTARRDVPVNGVVGYRAGDGMYQQVVDDLGLVLGVDVDAARPDLIKRPTDTATAARWREYALTQDPKLTRDEVDELTRADLIRRFPDPDAKPEAKPETAPKKAQPKP